MCGVFFWLWAMMGRSDYVTGCTRRHPAVASNRDIIGLLADIAVISTIS